MVTGSLPIFTSGTMSRCLPKATSPALSAPLGEFIGVWVCMVFMLSVNRAFELWVCTCVCV